jgi:YbbR domain-containing protein
MAIREIQDTERLPPWLSYPLGWLRWLFLEDWWVKLFALAISFALWWGVTGQRTPATVRIAGVQLNYRLPPQMEISNDPRREVEVTLTGAERQLQRMNPHDLTAYVDLSDTLPGDRVINLTPGRVRMGLPDGVRVDDIEPNTVALRLEPRIDREIDVEVRLEGMVPDGYEVQAVNATPGKVGVRGPQGRVNRLQNAPTETIPLTGRRDSFTVPQVAVDLPDQKVNVLDPVVSVNVVIGEKRIEKSFDYVTVSGPDGTKAKPSSVSVKLYGPPSVLNSLRPADISLHLELSANGQATPRLVLPADKSNGVELRSTSPSSFSIVK